MKFQLLNNLIVLFLISTFFVELSFAQDASKDSAKIITPTIVPSQKTAAARRILLAYKYPPLLNMVINDVVKNNSSNKKIATVEFRTKLLNLAFNTAVNDLSEKFSEADLIKMANVFSGPDGQLMINFIEVLFKSPNVKAVAAIKAAVQAEVKATTPTPTSAPTTKK